MIDTRNAVIRAIEGQFLTVDELVSLLEVTVEEIINRFPDRLVEHAEKFGVGPQQGEGGEEIEWWEEESYPFEAAEEKDDE